MPEPEREKRGARESRHPLPRLLRARAPGRKARERSPEERESARARTGGWGRLLRLKPCCNGRAVGGEGWWWWGRFGRDFWGARKGAPAFWRTRGSLTPLGRERRKERARAYTLTRAHIPHTHTQTDPDTHIHEEPLERKPSARAHAKAHSHIPSSSIFSHARERTHTYRHTY